MANTETFLATMGQVFVRVLDAQGIDAQALLAKNGISPATLRDPAARIPSDTVDKAMVQASPLISDAAFALSAATCWHPSNLGVMGYAWLSSSTLRTGLRRLQRFSRVIGERARFEVVENRDGLRFFYDHRRRDPLLQAVGTDFVMSVIMAMCRTNYGNSLRPLEVKLSRARPEDSGPWTRFYGCPVHFGAGASNFLLAPDDATVVLPTANRQLAGTFDAILEKQLAALDRSNIPAQCKATLLEHMTSGEISEIGMAKMLNMSRRTLQRKLAEAELSYQKLVDDTRRELALRYIEDSQKTLTDVTFLLGFSGQSAFTRAFRRWTGLSPSAFRERLRSRTA